MRFKAVIFDFGGVVTSSPFDAFAAYEVERGLPAAIIRTINAADPDHNAWAKFERAEIDAAAFDALFAAEAKAMGHDIPGRDVIALLSGRVRPAMVAAMDSLKAAGFRLGCITNNVPSGHGAGMARSEGAANAVAGAMTRFEHIIESSRAGIRKPDPRIYTMMCDALGLAPADCIYLDDLGINCKPAAVLGMHAIKVTGEDQALGDLEAATGITLR
jgi:putative hydrolase of the HAD superfamily